MLRSSSMVLLCLASMISVARAQGADPTAPAPPPSEPAPAPDPTAAGAPAPPPAPAASGGASLRNGFSLSVGQEYGSGPSSGLSGQLYGVDWRIGAKITDSIAAYLHSHLSLGTAKIGSASGLTGNFAAALIGEYALPQRIFFGGGAGYGVLNNPSGPLVQLRAGWYPLKKTSEGKARRLNVAFDARFYFAGDNVGTVSHLALSLGYDRF
jgi:hypothetical protein